MVIAGMRGLAVQTVKAEDAEEYAVHLVAGKAIQGLSWVCPAGCWAPDNDSKML